MDLSTLLKTRGWINRGANIFDYEINPDLFSRIALYPKYNKNEGFGIAWIRVQITEDGEQSPEEIMELFETNRDKIIEEAELKMKN